MLIHLKLRSFCAIVMMCGLLSACQSQPFVQTLADNTVDFSQYSTFAFHPQLVPENAEYEKLSTRYIKEAIIREMQNRGFRYDDEPDLWVNFHTFKQDKLTVTTMPHASLYYSYRMGYGVWADYPFYESRVDQYTEGTLNVDVVDRQRRQLIWEGIAVGRLNKHTLVNLESKVNEAVALMFARFP